MMKNAVKSILPFVINTVAFLIAIYFILAFYRLCAPEVAKLMAQPQTSWLGFLMLLIFVYLIRMSRLFFIIIEQKMNALAFANLFFTTTFVNIAVPFKLGEVYRYYRISHATKNYRAGLVSVILDRFFDVGALVCIVIPLELYYSRRLSTVTLALLMGLGVVTLLYTGFPAIYRYLNRFLMLKTSSMRSAKALKVLENFSDWYDFSRSFLKGRVVLITLLSFFGWIVEYYAIGALARMQGSAFNLQTFTGYINSIFNVNTQSITDLYFVINGIVLIFIIALIIIAQLIVRRKKHEANHCRL